LRNAGYGRVLASAPGYRHNAEMTALSWAWLSTPVGQVSVGCSADGVAQVRYGAPPARRDASDRSHSNEADESSVLAAAARDQLIEYFCGLRRTFDLPIDWSGTSGPQREVLQVLVGTVRYGQTISYGALAGRSGLIVGGDIPPARAVGKIMGSNPIPVIVPCHRVLAIDGLGGYSGGAGVEVKRWLLILEGALPPTLDWQPMDPVSVSP